jgi:peptidoglycan/xylan/chitin deacetylase (PgdA/CDA1 family)
MNSAKRSVKRSALNALRGAGFFALTRRLSSRKARVLMYHNFAANDDDCNFTSARVIRAQFQYLRQHFRVVPLLEIAQRLTCSVDLDPYTVAITIDDGRRNCYEILFPLLREFGFPATFFVVTSFIRGEDWVWTDKILWLSEQPSAPAELSPQKLAATFYALNRLRPEQRNRRIEELSALARVVTPDKPPAKYRPCSWSELREMAESGLVDIGSHTVSHPIMSSITDDESWQELVRSRREIESGVGRQVTCFCFPNGMAEDFRASQARQVANAGYSCSVVAEFGLVARGGSPYEIPRIGMGQKSDVFEIAKYLDGPAHYQRELGTLFGRRNADEGRQ